MHYMSLLLVDYSGEWPVWSCFFCQVMVSYDE